MTLVAVLPGCAATVGPNATPAGDAATPGSSTSASSAPGTTAHVNTPAAAAPAPPPTTASAPALASAPVQSAPQDEAGSAQPVARPELHAARPGAHGERVEKLAKELAERMGESNRLLSWCASNGPGTARQAARCRSLTATAEKARRELAVTAAPERAQARELRGTLRRLSAQMVAVSALVAAAPAAPAAPAAQAAIPAHQLPPGLARHSVPAVIAWHATAPATLEVAAAPGTEVMPRLSARLTVLEGNAVQVVSRPPMSQTQATGAPFTWTWTLRGVHEGRAEVRIELFIDPLESGGDSPIHYQTWEDDVIVQPSLLGNIQEATMGAGQLLFGGVAQSVRTALIAAVVAALLFAGVWLWRRSDAHSTYPPRRRG